MGNKNSPNDMAKYIGIEGYQPVDKNNKSKYNYRHLYEGYQPEMSTANPKKNKKEVPPPKAP